MNYTFIAIASYIAMRSLQVIFEGIEPKPWHRKTASITAVVVLYVALSSITVWYLDIWLLGFDPKK